MVKIYASKMVVLSAKERFICLVPRLNNASDFDPAYYAKHCV